MKITPEELQRRLRSSNNLCNRLNPNSPQKSKKGNDSNNRNNCGRVSDVPNAPIEIRNVAAILSAAENNAAKVSRGLDGILSPEQVRYADKTLIQRDNKLSIKEVQDVALTRLMDSMGLLTVEDISSESPKNISIIAANLSRVHSNLRERIDDTGKEAGKVVINLYTPEQKKIEDYDVIEVRTGT